MKINLLDTSTYKLLVQLYTIDEIIRILDGGIGKWIIIPVTNEPSYGGTAFVGERGEQRALKGFLN